MSDTHKLLEEYILKAEKYIKKLNSVDLKEDSGVREAEEYVNYVEQSLSNINRLRLRELIDNVFLSNDDDTESKITEENYNQLISLTKVERE